MCLLADYDRNYNSPSMRPPGELPVDALSPGVSHRAQLVLHLLVSLLSLLLPAIRRWFSRRGNGASSSSVYWTVTRPEAAATSFRYAGSGWMMDECDETRRAWNYFHTIGDAIDLYLKLWMMRWLVEVKIKDHQWPWTSVDYGTWSHDWIITGSCTKQYFLSLIY